MMWTQIKLLLIKDLTIEWRQKYALNGLLLYVLSTIYICYASFKLKSNDIDPITWNTLYWIVILFTAILSISKSFTQERPGRLQYLYSMTSPESLILAKILYNFLVLTIISLFGYFFYSVFMGNPVENGFIYFVLIILACFGISASLSLVASIASTSDNSAMLMPILSFPIIIPMLLLILKITKAAMDGLTFSESYDELLILGAIDMIVLVLSVILYQFLWRS